MRFFVVWFYFRFRNAVDRLSQRGEKVAQIRKAIACLMLKHLHYRVLLWLMLGAYRLPFAGSSLKARASVAAANKKSLLDTGTALDFGAFTLRRNVLELAATWGQNRRILAELAQCSAQLNDVVAPLHNAGKPVVLAPLHMVSDVLTGIVGAGVAPVKTTVIVSSSLEVYQQQVRAMGGIDLDYCSIHDDNREIAGNLMDAIMEAAENKRNIMVFPDITPDYTVNSNSAKTAKFPCQLFGRPANLPATSPVSSLPFCRKISCM